MKFKAGNHKVELFKYDLAEASYAFFTGSIHYNRKRQRAEKLMGDGWRTGNGVTVYSDGRISYDLPEYLSDSFKKTLLKKCKF